MTKASRAKPRWTFAINAGDGAWQNSAKVFIGLEAAALAAGEYLAVCADNGLTPACKLVPLDPREPGEAT